MLYQKKENIHKLEILLLKSAQDKYWKNIITTRVLKSLCTDIGSWLCKMTAS